MATLKIIKEVVVLYSDRINTYKAGDFGGTDRLEVSCDQSFYMISVRGGTSEAMINLRAPNLIKIIKKYEVLSV